MHVVATFIFLLLLGILIEMAKRRGEVKFTTTQREQKRLNRRGTVLHFLFWIPTGITLCVVLNSMAGGLQDHDTPVVYGFAMISAGIPAGILAVLANTLLEHIGATRIQRSSDR